MNKETNFSHYFVEKDKMLALALTLIMQKKYISNKNKCLEYYTTKKEPNYNETHN